MSSTLTPSSLPWSMVGSSSSFAKAPKDELVGIGAAAGEAAANAGLAAAGAKEPEGADPAGRSPSIIMLSATISVL